MKRVSIALALFLMTPFAACGGDDDQNETPDAAPNPETGTYYHFVTNTLFTPTTGVEANEFAVDLDGDGETDNGLGNILQTLESQSMPVHDNVQASVDAGRVIILFSVRADSLVNDSSVSWQVLLGSQTSAPAFDGSDSFTVDPTAPTTDVLTGGIVGGEFTGGPHEVTIRLALAEGADPITFPLVATRVIADVTEDGCTGVLAGAVQEDDIYATVLPEVRRMMNVTIVQYCGESRDNCTDGDTGDKIIDMFDKDGDREISETELNDSSIIQTFLNNDVDVVDGDGNPGSDGIDDSLSLAVKIECVPATFTVAGE